MRQYRQPQSLFATFRTGMSKRDCIWKLSRKKTFFHPCGVIWKAKNEPTDQVSGISKVSGDKRQKGRKNPMNTQRNTRPVISGAERAAKTTDP
jgi:hypothetical protein